MVKLAAKQVLANPQALVNIPAVSRQTGMIRYVSLIDQTNVLVAGTLPEFRLLFVPYRYDMQSTLVENPPFVYRPFDDSPSTPTGAYVMMDDYLRIAIAAPGAAPEAAEITWLARLTTPDRIVTWRSPKFLPAIPAVTDWQGDITPIPVTQDIATNGFPNFDADFVGQRVIDNTTNLIFRALNINTGSPTVWVLDMPDFVPIPTTNTLGGNIGGDRELAVTDHLQLRELTNSAIITLPATITAERIKVRLVHFEAIAGAATNITFRPASGATVNGDTVDVSGSNNIFDIFNHGTKWYAR